MEFMDDYRHDQLMKAASECVGLIGIGIEPNAALRKVAKDTSMNDKEVVLVSHAVNNARQLTHLQTSDADSKGNPFPMTNADEVIKDLHDTETADKVESSEDKQGQPDAVEIKKNVEKKAEWYEETGDYRKRAAKTAAADLRKAWGLSDGASATVDNVRPNPYIKLSAYKVAIEEARRMATDYRDQAQNTLDNLARELRKTAAPKFAEFEKAAIQCGAPIEIVDMLYRQGNFEALGAKRANGAVKVASTVFFPDDILKLAKDCVHVDTLCQQAADCAAAEIVMTEKLAFETAELNKLAKGDDKGFSVASLGKSEIDLSPSSMTEKVEQMPADLTGVGDVPEEYILGASNALKSEQEEVSLPAEATQELTNIDTQTELKQLMGDSYIKGYSVPEVVEAYNAAKSINPDFSNAEMVSYMRQHLATQGAMPIELQSRIKGKGKEGR